MLRISYFPTNWRISTVVMISKPGKDVNQTTLYRPISLLSILSKVFEKILLKSLAMFLAERQIIFEHQFGLRANQSTIEQVHRIVTIIRSAFEKKQYFSALFIDIDKVSHDGLSKITRLLPENTNF